MNIAVLGVGYVGLVAGACFAKLGFKVTCIDKDETKIAMLNGGKVHIHEPGLEEIVQYSKGQNKLEFTTSLSSLDSHEIIIIAVGTPEQADGSANLSYIDSAINDIINNTSQAKHIVIKSTVPVGTAEKVKLKLAKELPQVKHQIVSNPEFLREGVAVRDFLDPDRIVVGCSNGSMPLVKKLYRPLTSKNVPLVFTSNTSAELIKYTANSYLAMRLAFINEIADLAELVGANIDDITKGIGLDKRIGAHYLQPGPGYGGSCFPKDTKALAKTASQFNYNLSIVESVIRSNALRADRLAKKIQTILGEIPADGFISVLGLAFKADTDDLRESASVKIIHALNGMSYKIKVYDPSHPQDAKNQIPAEVDIAKSLLDSIRGSSGIIIATEWDEFKLLAPEIILQELKNPLVIDLRNIYDCENMKLHGISYHSIGRQ